MSFDRTAFAESVPVFAEAADDGTFRVVGTASGEPLSVEHATVRDALTSALDVESVRGFVKSANLRSGGEADGEWRWLDAASVEDQPIGKTRIGEQALWEMAESLNVRGSAIPINGGGGPEGLGASQPHGDAKSGGDHLANGYAHLGVPVVGVDARVHLFLWGELVAEIAAEVDRGRLAYGSVYFGYTSVDEDDNYAVVGATLVSHALTNDPANTNLSAGSERRRADGQQRACRSRWSTQMTLTIEQLTELHAVATDATAPRSKRYVAVRDIARAMRGAAGDIIGEAAALLGMSAEELAEDQWKLSDLLWALLDEAKIEDVLEGSEKPAEEPAEKVVEAQRPSTPAAARVDSSPEEQAAIDSMEACMAACEACMADMSPEALKACVDACAECVAACEAVMPEEDAAEEEPGEDAKSASVTRLRRQRDAARTTGAELRAKVDEYETREWLDGELAKRKKALSRDKHAQYVAIALRSGRETVLVFLDDLNVPPAGNPIAALEPVRGADVRTVAEAWDACEADALRELREAEDKRAKSERRSAQEPPRHMVRARAQDIARERYPSIVGA